MNEARAPRLAIVSGSMLTISSSRIELSPWTSAIVISPSPLEESGRESSVVVQNCLLWNDVGSMRGVVETSSFASLVGSVCVSIVGCSFDSSRIVGNDGIGLSLTRTTRKNVESIGRLSSSLIGCSFVNMSSIWCSHLPRLAHLDQKMLGCVVSLTSSHLSGSTIRDVNTGGSVLCSNSSFSSLLPSPDTDPESSKRHSHPSWRNFTHCQAGSWGGAMVFFADTAVLIESCRFEDCSTTGSSSVGEALILHGDNYGGTIKLFSLVDCVITDCLANNLGGGAHFYGQVNVFIAGTKQGECYVSTDYSVTIEWSDFIACSSKFGGGALYTVNVRDVDVSDTLVKECYSGTTGAVFLCPYQRVARYSLMDVLFVGNMLGDDTSFFTQFKLEENATKFHDLTIMSSGLKTSPQLKFENCYTTTSPNSTGMIFQGIKLESGKYNPERNMHDEFKKIGPLLTEGVTVKFDAMTGKVELEMEGITPLTSQEYEVTVRDGKTKTETRLRMLFSDGRGTHMSGSEVNLTFDTACTITSIEGIVPEPSSSSSSRKRNDIPIPVAAWAFNLDATPEFFTFTTPNPPRLISATSTLITDEQQFAHVLLVFNEKVNGSFDIVVLEEGKDVSITVSILEEAQAGESSKFIVVGDDRLLTHDTTYTIQSIVPTPGTNTLFVWMNDTIIFHIPKSSFVPPPEPIEDPEDPKKTLSPEMKAMLSWLIPLVACLLVALIVLIVVFVLVYRRKKNEPAQKEMEAQDEVRVEDKMEVVEVEYTNRVIETDGLGHSGAESSDVGSTRLNGSRGGLEGGGKEWVEVMACSGGFEISSAPMTNTLYSVLHKEHREIGKRGVGIQIVNGLKQIVAHRGWSDVLTRLSSHWILIDGSGNVQLKLQMNASEAEQELVQAQMHTQQLQPLPNLEETHNDSSRRTENSEKDKTGMDGMRWRAPEVVAGGLKGGEVDGQKASVFSLGLVLWEIETGQVPFGELDAVNAQRQSGTGIGPKMESLKNEEFIALIHRCVSVDPELRPTLSEIGEFLSSHPDETIGGSGNEMKE
ncbi:hypothetical protein BLNAU_9293 [Blattamonas nauphoetae]|uniref:Protein kinase domain-containing protein n=1 Tax=Blattamonas nauphoetae TaxID=2049346 RepID=A0ABQ9XW89_9EUKA|nr:hypothetical protein BLNAU_9293 [Blattamonas nauphoetae]